MDCVCLWCVSISKRRLWELSANEEAAFRSTTISKMSFGYIETGPWASRVCRVYLYMRVCVCLCCGCMCMEAEGQGCSIWEWVSVFVDVSKIPSFYISYVCSGIHTQGALHWYTCSHQAGGSSCRHCIKPITSHLLPSPPCLPLVVSFSGRVTLIPYLRCNW